jgi:hypothetical protein
MAVLRDYSCKACGSLWEELGDPLACPMCGRADEIERIFTAPKLGGFAAEKIRSRGLRHGADSNSKRIQVTVPEKIVK